jgi:hypothetical protein
MLTRLFGGGSTRGALLAVAAVVAAGMARGGAAGQAAVAGAGRHAAGTITTLPGPEACRGSAA